MVVYGWVHEVQDETITAPTGFLRAPIGVPQSNGDDNAQTEDKEVRCQAVQDYRDREVHASAGGWTAHSDQEDRQAEASFEAGRSGPAE